MKNRLLTLNESSQFDAILKGRFIFGSLMKKAIFRNFFSCHFTFDFFSISKTHPFLQLFKNENFLGFLFHIIQDRDISHIAFFVVPHLNFEINEQIYTKFNTCITNLQKSVKIHRIDFLKENCRK